MAIRSNGKVKVPEVSTSLPVIKVTDFQVISFFDEKAKRNDGAAGSEIILIYALGEDGVVREFANGKWTAFPVT
jgi:hypothetical protein